MHQSTGTKKKLQQLLRSGPIVPGNFSFSFLVPVQVWCILSQEFADASDFWQHMIAFGGELFFFLL